MDILSKIFGSLARVKIMRLFLLNKDSVFDNKEIVKRSRVNSKLVNQEVKILHSIGFIKKNSKGWSFNSSFKYINEIEDLLINSESLDKKVVWDNLKKVGQIKLLIVSGIFIKNKDSRVDLLIVGDKIKKSKTEEGIKKLEAEIGKEIIYAAFETKEFFYRLSMYDKLIRDIIDFPHEIIFKAKELSTHSLKNR
jgi:hypothetical protein